MALDSHIGHAVDKNQTGDMTITVSREGKEYDVTEIELSSTYGALLCGIEEACAITRPFEVYDVPSHEMKQTDSPPQAAPSQDAKTVVTDDDDMELQRQQLGEPLQFEEWGASKSLVSLGFRSPLHLVIIGGTPAEVVIEIDDNAEQKAAQQHIPRNTYLQWACTACKWVNLNEVGSCMLCKKLKSEQALWMCNRCTFRQSTANPECVMCSTKRPDYIVPPMVTESKELEQPSVTRALSKGVLSLTRAVSGGKREFFCSICMNNCTANDRAPLSCIHPFCKMCVRDYVTFEILEGRVQSITCCESDCKTPITLEAMKNLCSKETMGKYRQFLKLKENENYRACPTCNHLTLGSSLKKSMTCERIECATKFCFDHSNAHPNQTCSWYLKKNRQAFAKSAKFIDEHTVHCPNPFCRVPIVKSSGCNHMSCTRCHTQFCYLCGGFNLGGLHYAPFWWIGCPYRQGYQGEANQFGKWYYMLLRWLIVFPIWLGVISALISLVLSYWAVLLGLGPLICVFLYIKQRIRSQNNFRSPMQIWCECFAPPCSDECC